MPEHPLIPGGFGLEKAFGCTSNEWGAFSDPSTMRGKKVMKIKNKKVLFSNVVYKAIQGLRKGSTRPPSVRTIHISI
jgi:hypothetical protein